MAKPIIVAGIDEAGYGPILGPLVISAAAFELPADVADRSLWELLSGSVTARVSVRDRRLAILDSKKIYHRDDGLGRLERGVLATFHAWKELPDHLSGLIRAIAPDAVVPLADHRWYADDPALPSANDAGGVRIAGVRLRSDLADQGGRVAGIWSEVLPEGRYNRMVRSIDNKAIVLFGLTLRLIQRLADAYPRHDIVIAIDKQGARDHYAPALLRAFDGRHLRILDEGPEHSAYELAGPATRWRVSFSKGGESRSLPTALASMVSKYLREQFMGCFNRWWHQQVPGVAPTAGYYQDGLRFLSEVEPHFIRLGVDRDTLVRER